MCENNARASTAAPGSLVAETGRSYHLEDWLRLHGLTVPQCEDVLSRAGDAGSDHDSRVHSIPAELSGEHAWQMAADAMLSMVPQAAEQIRNTRDKAVRIVRAPGGRDLSAFTVPDGRSGAPVVLLRYCGRSVDLITVAHEFGHAVQILASGASFVPPTNRELCAFISELALIRHLRVAMRALHGPVLAAWRSRNRNYLGRYREVLSLALKDPRSEYHYRWNYPVARVLASECVQQLPPDALWSIFENRISLSGVVTFLGCSQRRSRSCRGACMNGFTEMVPAPLSPDKQEFAVA